MAKVAQKDQIHHDIAGEDILSVGDDKFRTYRRLWEENPQNLDPGHFPLHLDIEVTSACNLKCPFCATTYSGFKSGFIKWEMVKRILDEAGEKRLYACKFNFRGEPLLHKELGKFISYAKKKGIIDVFFNTNASLLTEEKSRMLVDSGLDRITISFEGFDKASYEKNRVGATFEEVVNNVENLRNIREKSGVSTPKIRVQTVLVPELERRIDEFIAFWECRVDQVSYNDMEPTIEVARKKSGHLETSWICPFLYQRMAVLWDGTLTACIKDYDGKLVMGNIDTMSIQKCWTVHLNGLRKQHVDGMSHEVDACMGCPLRMSELIRRKEI